MSLENIILQRLIERANQNSSLDIKYYQPGYFDVGDYRGASLSVIFRVHSLEEAYLKLRRYFLIYATELQKKDIIHDDLEIYDDTIADELDINIYDSKAKYSTKEIDGIIDIILEGIIFNDTLWLNATSITPNLKYIL